MTPRVTWGYIAARGAGVGVALTMAYTGCFIIYAWVRAARALQATMSGDPAQFGTFVATAASLSVAAGVIATFTVILTAILGALTGLVLQGLLARFNRDGDSRQAVLIGVAAMALIVVVMDVAFRFHALQLETFLFWVGLPSAIYIVAGGIAARQLARLRSGDTLKEIVRK
jgi:hypothetical protein